MSDTHTPTRRGRIVALLVGFLVVAILLVLAEGGIRVRQWIKHDRSVFRIESLYHIDPATGLRTPVPGTKTSRISIDSLGFRGPGIANPKPPGTIRIAFLGGSTTFNAVASSDETTWPHRVIEALRKKWPDQNFDYINGGVPGYAVGHSRRNLELRVKQHDPEVIVIYHASNDLSGNSFEEARALGIVDVRADRALSWPAQYSLLWYLVEKNLTILRIQSDAADESNKLPVNLESLTEPFERDLTELVIEARKIAKVVALVTFSTHLRPEQDTEYRLKAAESSLYYMPYMTPQALIDSFAAYNQVIRSVARRFGVILIDKENEIPGDRDHFVDSVHFTDAGNAVMAKRVVGGLVTGGLPTALGL